MPILMDLNTLAIQQVLSKCEALSFQDTTGILQTISCAMISYSYYYNCVHLSYLMTDGVSSFLHGPVCQIR